MRYFLWLFLLAGAAASVPAYAQGCSQCKDTVAQSSPRSQAAIRHSIVLMGSAAIGCCIGVFAVAKTFGKDR